MRAFALLPADSGHYCHSSTGCRGEVHLSFVFVQAPPHPPCDFFFSLFGAQVVAAVLGRRERPRIPSQCPQALSQLMQACWSHDPDQRPCFDDVVPWLESL